jgi:hypothetical protein
LSCCGCCCCSCVVRAACGCCCVRKLCIWHAVASCLLSCASQLLLRFSQGHGAAVTAIATTAQHVCGNRAKTQKQSNKTAHTSTTARQRKQLVFILHI